MNGIVIKLKDGKEKQWRSWCTELQTTLKSAAIETIIEEGLTQELAAIFKINGSSYIIGMMDGDFSPGDPTNPINIKHKKMKEECFDPRSKSKIETLYHLKI